MKFSNMITAVLSTLLLACCTQKIQQPDDSIYETIDTIHAALASTKVAFSEEGKSEWEESDEICVMCDGVSSMFSATSSGPAVDFTGEIAVKSGCSIWGVYPFTSFISGNQNDVTVCVPSSQSVRPDSYANNIRIAKASGDEMFFRNACASLKFKVSEAGISRATIRSNGSSFLAGNVTFEMKDGIPSVGTVTDGSYLISIEPEGGEFQVGKYYYVAILPGITDTYTITFEKGETLASVVKGPYTFQRNKNLRLDNPDAGLEWNGMVLNFDFSEAVNWDLCKSASPEKTEYTVTDSNGNTHNFIYKNCYSSSTSGGSKKYLVISKGYLGLPAMEGYRLSSVYMELGNNNTKRSISVNSNDYAAAIMTNNGSVSEVQKTDSQVRFDLPNTIDEQRYWLYSNTTFVLGRLKLCYEPASVPLSDVDKVIERAIADGTVPGAVLGVWKDGSIVYKKAYGNKSVTPSVVKMTEDVVFDMASVSKAMGTSMAVMQLHEQGRLDVGAKISEYLPEFSADDPLTLTHLLTHSGGLVKPSTDYKAYAGSPQAYLEATAVHNRASAPGEKYSYNCINFFILQQIVEKITGQRLCDYIQTNVFGPLGMDDTKYLPINGTTDPAYKARIAPTTSKTSDTGRVYDTMARVVCEGNAGNAGVFSTVDDALKLGQALLAGGILNGNRVLQEETVQLMGTIVDPAIGRALGWDSASVTGYEKGSFISSTAFFHTGYCGTMLIVDRENNMCIALLANRTHPQNTGYAEWNRYRGYICDIIGKNLCK